jgi:hypothetical protein
MSQSPEHALFFSFIVKFIILRLIIYKRLLWMGK